MPKSWPGRVLYKKINPLKRGRYNKPLKITIIVDILTIVSGMLTQATLNLQLINPSNAPRMTP